MKDKEIYIKVTKNGPYLLYGLKKITIKYIISDENGVAFKYDEGKTFEIKPSHSHYADAVSQKMLHIVTALI